MSDCLLTLCIHGQLRDTFLRTNRDALKALSKLLPFELVSWGEQGGSAPGFPSRSVKIGEAGYNQAMQLLWRHATSPTVMVVDASMRIQPEALVQACSQIMDGKPIAAVALPSRWRGNVRKHFLERLSPGPIVLRREVACRFVRATEGGLLCGWSALAQLEPHGKIIAVTPAASIARCKPQGEEWRFDVRNAFFDSGRPERYCGSTALYDTSTLERVLADAEQFILRWPGFSGLPLEDRRELMFHKRRRLYETAMRQALEDGEETLALHFATRLRVSVPVAEEPANAKALRHPQLWDLVPTQTQPLRDMAIANADAAIAEQIRLFYDILGEGTQLYLEEHPQLQAMAEEMHSLPVQWLAADALHEKPAEPNELVVFYASEALQRRKAAQGGVSPGRQLSVEQLNGWLTGPLHAML